MQSFWKLLSSGMLKQTVTCQECHNVTTQNESFTDLILKFPESHHIVQGKNCTLNNLFEYNRSEPRNIEGYDCNCCHRRTIATQHEDISVYPEYLVIVLCLEKGIAKGNDNNINTLNTEVEYPLKD